MSVSALVFLLLFPASLPAFAENCERPVQVTIHSVLASDTNKGVDVALQPMSGQLTRLFRFSTYVLVNQQEGLAQCGKMISFTLPGGRILDVEPRKLEGKMISMQVLMFEGERPVMSTDLKLHNGGVLMIGGRRYEQGMLIISVGAETPPSTPEQAPALAHPQPSNRPASADTR